MLLISMARTMMTSLIVLAWVVADREVPTCDGDLYGHPNANHCSTILSILQNSIDQKHHVFALPSLTRRPQNPANYQLEVSTYKWRNNRVQLPVVRGSPQSKCHVGIFPIELPDGSSSWDHGFYRYIAMDGRTIMGDCINSKPNGPGGRFLSGSAFRLALILYEPGSEWDFQVQAAEAQNRPIFVPLVAAGNPAVAGVQGSTPSAPLPVASTVTTATTTVKPNPTIKPEPDIKPKPGVKPHPDIPGAPWSAWGMNYGAEGQGSSWE